MTPAHVLRPFLTTIRARPAAGRRPLIRRAAIRHAVPRRAAAPALPAVLYTGFAVFAVVTAAVSGLAPHRAWGAVAAAVYGIGALAALTPRGRRHRTLLAAAVSAAALLVPAAVLIATGQAQPEVGVVHRSGALLLEHGTPYLGAAELAAHGGYEAYNPYVPGMALLGVPWAVAGIDARLLFGGSFLVTLLLAVVLGTGVRRVPAEVLVLAGSPLVALPLAVGGDDLPVIGLTCLGLALAVRDRPGAAGLAVGTAAVLKATAWPALPVCLALVAARAGGRDRVPLDACRALGSREPLGPAGASGRSAVVRFGAAASGVLAAGVLLPALTDPDGFVRNVVRFPLGLAGTASPADSPLPGRLLADLGPLGHAAALVLLGLAALTMGVSLLVRPPADARRAALRLALGLLLAAALMPATRWGYLVYPAVLALWARHGTPPAPEPRPRLRWCRHGGPCPDCGSAPEREEDLCLVA